jgi:hypothetical protein
VNAAYIMSSGNGLASVSVQCRYLRRIYRCDGWLLTGYNGTAHDEMITKLKACVCVCVCVFSFFFLIEETATALRHRGLGPAHRGRRL